MKIPKLFENIIKQTKELAKPGDLPMCYFKDPEGKMTIAALAVGKPSIKLALYAFMQLHQAEEICFVIEAWYVERKNGRDFKGEVRNQPDRKECFIVSYFSKDAELIQSLPFERKIKGKKETCLWLEAPNLEDLTHIESRFNPFKMTDEEIKLYQKQSQLEIMRVNGKKEIHKLPFDYKFIIYRHEGKAFFECLKSNGEAFMSSDPIVDDEKFQSDLNLALKTLTGDMHS